MLDLNVLVHINWNDVYSIKEMLDFHLLWSEIWESQLVTSFDIISWDPIINVYFNIVIDNN